MKSMKHKSIKAGSLLLVAIMFLAQCTKDDRAINLNLSAVPNIFSPADGKSIKLKPAANLVETFEWEQSKAEDGSLVLYEVAFDQVGGDFSKPFYTVTSDSRGVLNKLTITHGDLNKIAALGGADFFQKKKFIWTVLASKGTNVKKSEVSRTIELERPGGFAVLPGSMYITGTATENGDVLTNALKMKQVSSGVFEIFTKLKAGTYRFVDANTGTPKVYFLRDDAGIKVIDVNGNTSFTGADKIMRIVLNFNNVNGNMVEVKSIQFWYAQGNTTWFTMNYVSNGVWQYPNWATTLLSVPWGLEERYKYKMVINDGTGDSDLWINSNFGDPAGQDGQYPSSVAYRTINLDQNNGSQYDWGWKFDRNYIAPQGTPITYTVSLRGSDAAYTQNYQK
jgi:starch-binding outer membrane protein SusE/F